jgi:FAD/FMN-containing dehydrogenase
VLTPPALAGFRERFKGHLVTPDDPEYDKARVIWNAMADRRPALIARCADVDDVIASVRFARDEDLVIAVRGGGHSVAGFSTCDGGIVIDLSRMNGVTIDPQRQVAHADGGAHLSRLDREAQAFELVCPVGVVGHTGVGGLTLGGGMGRLQRKYGFTIDSLLSVDLVTAEGMRMHVSKDENPDLFWGLRGAGANFGVVTSFEYQLHPQGTLVTHGSVAAPIERSGEVTALVREYLATAPDEVFLGLSFGAATAPPFPPEMEGHMMMMVGAMHSGSPAEAERHLRPLRAGLDWSADTFVPKQYLAVQGMNDEPMAWGMRFYMKGSYLSELSDEVVAVCAAQAADVPVDGDCSVSFWAQGGAINRVPEDGTAFTGRNAPWSMTFEAMWADAANDDAHRSWARRGLAAVKPFAAAGHYVNDAVESDVSSVRAIYGDEKYERLVRLKRKYDPENVFRLNQNIRP